MAVAKCMFHANLAPEPPGDATEANEWGAGTCQDIPTLWLAGRVERVVEPLQPTNEPVTVEDRRATTEPTGDSFSRSALS